MSNKKQNKLKKSINTLSSIHKIGYKMVQAYENYSLDKKVIIASKPKGQVEQELKDYIFGLSDYNPFKEVTDEFNSIIKTLENKTNKVIESEIKVQNYLGKGTK